MLSIGFLLAGVLGFADFDQLARSANREDRIFGLIDALLFGSLELLTSGMAKNWSKWPEERRRVYLGLGSVAATVVFGGVAVFTK